MARQGRKPTGKPRQFSEGAISENRIAWLQTYIGQFILMMYPEGFSDETDAPSVKGEPGPTLRLILPKNGRVLQYSLTALTVAEFDLLEEFFQLAFSIARPIVELRDQVAQDEYDQGNDAFARIYRQVPRLIVREREIGQHGVSVRDGSESVPDGDRPGVDPEGRLRGDGGELADGEPEAHRAEDDIASAD